LKIIVDISDIFLRSYSMHVLHTLLQTGKVTRGGVRLYQRGSCGREFEDLDYPKEEEGIGKLKDVKGNFIL
jgi:hypothetical protein